MVVLKDYNFLGMGLQILLRQIHFRSFLMVATIMIVVAIFIMASTSSIMVIHTLGSLVTLTRLSVIFPFYTGVGTLGDVD
jgi:hypothetical protein